MYDIVMRLRACARQIAVAGALALGIASPPADATVFFQWKQNSSIPEDNTIELVGWIAVSDFAFQNGVVFHGYNEIYVGSGQHIPDWSSLGVEGIYFSTKNSGAVLQVGLADLIPYPGELQPGSLVMWNFSLLMSPLNIPEVKFYYNNQQSDFGWELNSQFSFAWFNTDGDGGPCFMTGSCEFYGSFTKVPEPSSAALLATGLGIIYRLGRRRR